MLRIKLMYSNITAVIMSGIKDYLQAAQAGQQHLVYLVDQYPPRKQPTLQYDYKCNKMSFLTVDCVFGCDHIEEL